MSARRDTDNFTRDLLNRGLVRGTGEHGPTGRGGPRPELFEFISDRAGVGERLREGHDVGAEAPARLLPPGGQLKVIGTLSVLFEMFVSPGTFPIVAVSE